MRGVGADCMQKRAWISRVKRCVRTTLKALPTPPELDEKPGVCSLLSPLEDTRPPPFWFEKEDAQRQELERIRRYQRYMAEIAAEGQPNCCETLVSIALRSIGLGRLLEALGAYNNIEKVETGRQLTTIVRVKSYDNPEAVKYSKKRTLELINTALTNQQLLWATEDCLITSPF